MGWGRLLYEATIEQHTGDPQTVEDPLNPATSRPWWRRLGLITGAPGDDPSGIAIYSQVEAQFGYGLL